MDNRAKKNKERIEQSLNQWPVIESYEIIENPNWEYCFDLEIKFSKRVPMRLSIQRVFNGWIVSETSKNPFYRSIDNGIKQLIKGWI